MAWAFRPNKTSVYVKCVFYVGASYAMCRQEWLHKADGTISYYKIEMWERSWLVTRSLPVWSLDQLNKSGREKAKSSACSIAITSAEELLSKEFTSHCAVSFQVLKCGAGRSWKKAFTLSESTLFKERLNKQRTNFHPGPNPHLCHLVPFQIIITVLTVLVWVILSISM